MRLGRFDMNLLLALDALLDTRSVSQAAERLHVGQSAMSSALGRLREHFSDELLAKSGRGLELTPFAKGLRAPVQEALVSVRHAVAPPRDFDPATAERRFEIRASDYLVSSVLSALMRKLEDEAPGISFVLADTTDDLSELLNRGTVDLVIANEDYLVENHPREFLFRDESVGLVARDHPTVGDTVSLPQFLAMDHVAVQIGTPQTRQHEAWLLNGRELRRRIVVTVSRFNALPQFIVETRRIGMTHRRHAEWWSRHFPLRIVNLPFEVTQIGIHMQWNRNLDRDPAHVWLREQIRSAIGA